MSSSHLLGGSTAVTLSSNTKIQPYCSYDYHGGDSSVELMITAAGTLKNFKVKLGTAPGAGDTWTFTVRKNEADQALVVAIADANTEGSDEVNTVSVVPGDTICVSAVETNAPENTTVAFSLEFDSTTADETLWGGGSFYGSLSTTNTEYTGPFRCDKTTNEVDTYFVAPMSGTLKNLYVALDNAPGVGKSRAFTVRQNAGDTSVTCTISDTNKTGNDTVHTLNVTAGERINFKMVPAGTPVASKVRVGCTFVPSTSGQFAIGWVGGDTPHAFAIEYVCPTGGKIFGGGETGRQQRCDACTTVAMYAWLGTAPGAGNSWVLTLRDDEADTGLAVTISDADTSGNTASSDAIADGSMLAFKCEPISGPTGTKISLSVCCIISVGTPSASPSASPSGSPSGTPSVSPSGKPSASPSGTPSMSPSISPSISPSVSPSGTPSISPSGTPSVSPSGTPSVSPSGTPSVSPSGTPSVSPSGTPSASPSGTPSVSPSGTPSVSPSVSPSGTPSVSPSGTPSASPSGTPSVSPSGTPSVTPSVSPSGTPSISPSVSPSVTPSVSPSVSPSGTPSVSPSVSPSVTPSVSPSLSPSVSPSVSPSASPSAGVGNTYIVYQNSRLEVFVDSNLAWSFDA